MRRESKREYVARIQQNMRTANCGDRKEKCEECGSVVKASEMKGYRKGERRVEVCSECFSKRFPNR